MGLEILATVYGLASALSWGTSDFSGAIASKRSGVYGVVIASQGIGLVMLVMLGVAFGERIPSLVDVAWAGVAGLCGLAGLVALYQGLAAGRMGIVAPVSALVAGVVPVSVSILTEGLPTSTRMAGFAIALVAVWLVSAGEGIIGISIADLRLPIIAGMGFGFFFVFINRMTAEDVFLPLAVARVAPLICLLLLTTIRGLDKLPAAGSGLFVLFSGVFDAGGNVFFALSAQVGRLDTAAVIGSLYPAVTVLLAWLVLRERISSQQWAGIALSLLAIVLIAS